MKVEIVKLILIALLSIIGGFILLESSLKLGLGLGNPLLYQADEEIGYLLAPNQSIRRFGNLIEINQYSMRSEVIDQERPANTTRILILGDSIANGAWWTDQTKTIPSLIQQQLTQVNSQILNASANSWGPRNQLAYLKRFGTFDAQIMILLLNTDDLFAPKPSSLAVGRNFNYPNRKPPLAVVELFNRYFSRSQPLSIAKEKDSLSANLAAVEEIATISQQQKALFFLAITPLLRELESNHREYEQKAKSRLQTLAQTASIPYCDFLPLFQTFNPVNSLYRDHIHLSPQGNELVSQTLSQAILEGKLMMSNCQD